MSAALDYDAGDPWYTTSVGPQSDGTYGIPTSGQAVVPYDAGGGPSANYSGAVLDIFRLGVGAWQQNQVLDYKRYEATQSGLNQQGQANATVYAAQAQAKSNSNLLLMVMIGAAVFMLVRD